MFNLLNWNILTIRLAAVWLFNDSWETQSYISSTSIQVFFTGLSLFVESLNEVKTFFKMLIHQSPLTADGVS